MNVLVVGSGGREHALAWKISQSPRVGDVFVAPGNAGTAEDAVNVDIGVGDFEGLIDFAKKNDVRLTAIGRLDLIPDGARRELDRTMEMSAGHQGLNLCLALSYGGRAEIDAEPSPLGGARVSITFPVQHPLQRVADSNL